MLLTPAERDKTDCPLFIPGEAYQNDTAALPCYIDSIEIDDNSRWLPFEAVFLNWRAFEVAD